MRYLKKSAEVLIGKAGGQNEASQFYYNVADYTVMVAMTTNNCDGLEEEFSGICVTREQLEQIRNEIDRYLSETADNKPEPEPEPESVKLVNNFSIESEMHKEEIVRIFASASQKVAKQLQNSCQEGIPVAIDPKLVMVNQLKPTGEPDSWFAKICVLTGVLSDPDGKLEVSVLGDSEENARAKLNTGFHDLIMACLYPNLSKQRIPDIVRENQQSALENGEEKLARVFASLSQQVTELQNSGQVKGLLLVTDKVTSKKTNEGWEARTVYWKGCNIELTAFGDTETEARTKLYKELIVLLQDQLTSCVDHSSVANKPEDFEQANKADDKDSALLRLKPSRVMSIKVGADKWEARTKLFSWTSDGLTDLVATADSEEAAREELDKKFSNLADPMMNFIKFMSQDP